MHVRVGASPLVFRAGQIAGAIVVMDQTYDVDGRWTEPAALPAASPPNGAASDETPSDGPPPAESESDQDRATAD
ncbi:hypothetical protein [Cryptosporangium minutisporangium]|uniref:Uncharacterized protein n=1 Tax=Cryptosporangium minutisporangium TaxID=113569 RepID=A0ABP6TC99_9ACTN